MFVFAVCYFTGRTRYPVQYQKVWSTLNLSQSQMIRWKYNR